MNRDMGFSGHNMNPNKWDSQSQWEALINSNKVVMIGMIIITGIKVDIKTFGRATVHGTINLFNNQIIGTDKITTMIIPHGVHIINRNTEDLVIEICLNTV